MYSLPFKLNFNFDQLFTGVKIVGLLCCFVFTSHLSAQLYTGTTLQFAPWTSNIGIGANSNSVNKLYVRGNVSAAGAAVFGETNSTNSNSRGVEGKSLKGAGVRAESVDGFGLYATSLNSTAIRGYGTNATGMYGSSVASYGVYGQSTNGTGIHGTSTSGVGVYGTSSSNYAAQFVGTSRLDGKVEVQGDLDMDRYQNFYFGEAEYTGLFYSTTSSMASPRAFDGEYFNGPVLHGRHSGTLGIKRDGGVEKAVLTWDKDEQVFIAGATTTGISNPTDYSLFVEKGIATGKVKVDAALADYVFEEEYEFQTIEELDTFIQENSHLPGVISAAEAAENGVELSSFTVSLQEKIEELALYIIDMNERLKTLEEENEALRNNTSQD